MICLPCLLVSSGLHRTDRSQQTTAFDQRPYQVHDRVDQAPRQVAADGRQEQSPDLLPPLFRDRDRADESERHEQAEEKFRHTVHGIQYRFADIALDVFVFAHDGRKG